MDPNRLTQKSQEALHDAQTKALRFGHTEVDGEHLLLALLDQPEGIAPRLLAQANANPDRLRTALDAELSRRPRVTGPGVNPGEVRVTQRLARLLDEAEQEAVRWARPPRGPGSARWSPADAVLIDEARGLIERIPSLSHVVVDEAQDLSPMECRAIGRRCATGAATVLGDVAQGTTPWATASWAELLGHLGKPEAELRVLRTGYRVPRQILDYASRLLSRIAPGLSPASSLREDPGALQIMAVPAGELDGQLAQVCAEAAAQPGSVAVIAADQQLPELSRGLTGHGLAHDVLDGEPAAGGRLTLVPVTMSKGLEFDHVIVIEPAAIARAEARGLPRLYVALTRAVSRLTVLHTEPLPMELAGPLADPAD